MKNGVRSWLLRENDQLKSMTLDAASDRRKGETSMTRQSLPSGRKNRDAFDQPDKVFRRCRIIAKEGAESADTVGCLRSLGE